MVAVIVGGRWGSRCLESGGSFVINSLVAPRMGARSLSDSPALPPQRAMCMALVSFASGVRAIALGADVFAHVARVLLCGDGL